MGSKASLRDCLPPPHVSLEHEPEPADENHRSQECQDGPSLAVSSRNDQGGARGVPRCH